MCKETFGHISRSRRRRRGFAEPIALSFVPEVTLLSISLKATVIAIYTDSDSESVLSNEDDDNHDLAGQRNLEWAQGILRGEVYQGGRRRSIFPTGGQLVQASIIVGNHKNSVPRRVVTPPPKTAIEEASMLAWAQKKGITPHTDTILLTLPSKKGRALPSRKSELRCLLLWPDG